MTQIPNSFCYELHHDLVKKKKEEIFCIILTNKDILLKKKLLIFSQDFSNKKINDYLGPNLQISWIDLDAS